MASKTAKSKGTKKIAATEAKLSLNHHELTFLRDLTSMLAPVVDEDGETQEMTVSEALAEATERGDVETSVWQKIADACASLGVAIGENVVTHAISPAMPPPLHVYEVE